MKVVNCNREIYLGGKQILQRILREGTVSYLSSGFSFSEAAVVAACWFSPNTPGVDQEVAAVEALQEKHILVTTDSMVLSFD